LGSVARVAALLIVVVVAACGESEDAGQSDMPATSVEVTLWPEGRSAGSGQRAILTCEPVGGSHPHAQDACAALESEPDALEPVAGDVACTQIYGGPEEARIAGVVAGNAVDSMFSRTNGCEIDRWDRLAPVLDVLPTA
jgi:hypothetical protein